MLITNLAFPVFAIGRTYLSGAITFGTITKGVRNAAFPLACSALNSILVAPITFRHATSFYGIQQAMVFMNKISDSEPFVEGQSRNGLILGEQAGGSVAKRSGTL
jgi:hypothetical protein